jgi:gas vesicle protein
MPGTLWNPCMDRDSAWHGLCEHHTWNQLPGVRRQSHVRTEGDAMSMDDYTNGRGISTGTALLVGAVVGAGLALLYAPRSGRETRHQLSAGATRLREKANDAYGTVSARARQTADRARGVANDVQSKGKYVVDRARDAYRQTRRDFESAAQDVADDSGFNG